MSLFSYIFPAISKIILFNSLLLKKKIQLFWVFRINEPWTLFMTACDAGEPGYRSSVGSFRSASTSMASTMYLNLFYRLNPETGILTSGKKQPDFWKVFIHHQFQEPDKCHKHVLPMEEPIRDYICSTSNACVDEAHKSQSPINRLCSRSHGAHMSIQIQK